MVGLSRCGVTAAQIDERLARAVRALGVAA